MTPWRYIAAWLLVMVVWGIPSIASSTAEPSMQSRRLWRLAELEQLALEQSGALLHDAAMERILMNVAMRLWDQVTTDLRPPEVEVIRETRTDAVTYPNGVILLTTGMLEQIENEDQLAMILAHELIHYTRQHTIQLYDRIMDSVHTDGLPSTKTIPVIRKRDVEEQVNAAEYQADSEGLALFKAAGYCEAEIPNLISTMIDHMRAQGPSKSLDDLISRKIRIEAMIRQDPQKAACPTPTDSDQGFFLACIAPALMANTQTAIQHGEWGVADDCIEKYIAKKSDDARAYYLQGEIMRRRDDGDHENQCKAYYETALEIDPQYPLVHRALGELYFKAGHYQEAKPHFEAFLSLAPEDESRAYIEGYLRLCQN
jgi:predicted Zn-dependent protease